MRQLLLLVIVLISCKLRAHAQALDSAIRYGAFVNHGPQETTVREILRDQQFYISKAGCKITGFDISGAAMGKDYIGPYHSDNNKLTKPQINYINSLESGGQLWLHDIHIKCKDGQHVVGTGQTEFSIYFFNIL